MFRHNKLSCSRLSLKGLAELALVSGMAACISVDVEPEPWPCPTRQGADVSRTAVVSVLAEVPSVPGGLRGFRECSGVAIAPRLVVTALNCAFPRPPQLPCDPDDGTSIEDGSFAGRLLDSLGASAFSISGGNDPRTVGVNAIMSSGSQSRCTDDLAVLLLDSALDVPAVPLRLEEETVIGEPVTLSGFAATGERRDLISSVERITLADGIGGVPARSLLVPVQACLFDTGGGVFAIDSGALVGIISRATGAGCGDPDGATIATRIAAFRRLLLQAGEEQSELLSSELLATKPNRQRSCVMD